MSNLDLFSVRSARSNPQTLD